MLYAIYDSHILSSLNNGLLNYSIYYLFSINFSFQLLCLICCGLKYLKAHKNQCVYKFQKLLQPRKWSSNLLPYPNTPESLKVQV